jgi:hypothetical protein
MASPTSPVKVCFPAAIAGMYTNKLAEPTTAPIMIAVITIERRQLRFIPFLPEERYSLPRKAARPVYQSIVISHYPDFTNARLVAKTFETAGTLEPKSNPPQVRLGTGARFVPKAEQTAPRLAFAHCPNCGPISAP